MAVLPNLGLQDLPQGTIRFDLVGDSNAKILDAHFEGSSGSIMGVGHAGKQIISWRPGGVEKVKLDGTSGLLEFLAGVGCKFNTFSGTAAKGIVRVNGSALEFYDGAAWVNLTAGGAGVTGSGTSPGIAKWNGASSLTDAHNMTAKAILSNATGLRTLYTCPSGKKALVGAPFWDAESVVASLWRVDSGQTKGAKNKVFEGAHTANGNTNTLLWYTILDAGDFIEFTSASTVVATMKVFEYPDTSFPELVDIRAEDVGTTLVTAYTVPAGKCAGWIDRVNLNKEMNLGLRISDRWVGHNNDSATRTPEIHLNTAGSDVKVTTVPGQGADNFWVNNQGFALSLEAGDIIKYKSSAVTSINFYGVIGEWVAD